MSFNTQVFKTRTLIHFGCWWEFVKLLKKIKKQRYLSYSIFGLLYITIPVLMMVDMGTEWRVYTIDNTNEIIYDKVTPCAIIFSIWINDTMAYIVGSLIGKTPLSPISPKKTWEGTLGGIILATIIAWVIAWQFDFDIKTMVVIALVSSITGTFGDLFESKLKRMAGVKDSGSFMPGHGGFLDRFDSLLFAFPFVWLFLKLVVH
jgi:phosphatidate cytidylyltransferase